MAANGEKKRYLGPILMLVSAALLWGLGPARIDAHDSAQPAAETPAAPGHQTPR